jgi:hypothetical protein
MTLSNNFYLIPDYAKQTVKRKELQETLLSTDGRIISQGRLRELKTKHLGVGIYEISLKPLKD